MHAEDGRALTRVYCILLGLAVFVTLSLLLYIAHVHVGASDVVASSGQAANNGKSELLDAIGLHVTRTVLPLYQSLNAGGAMGVIALVVGIMLRRKTHGLSVASRGWASSRAS